jgi:hypothetical protein
MKSPRSLDALETDVLARIARHRTSQEDSGTLPAGVTLAALALSIGLVVGWNEAGQATSSHGSESIVLADEAQLAPSTLFAAYP